MVNSDVQDFFFFFAGPTGPAFFVPVLEVCPTHKDFRGTDVRDSLLANSSITSIGRIKNKIEGTPK